MSFPNNQNGELLQFLFCMVIAKTRHRKRQFVRVRSSGSLKLLAQILKVGPLENGLEDLKGRWKQKLGGQFRNNAPSDSFFRVKSWTWMAQRTQRPRGEHAQIL